MNSVQSKSSLVTIAILNYNGLKYLKKTIPKILKLNYPFYEILVVDNNSTDKSVEYIKKFKKIRLIENLTNQGYSAGKNVCVKNSLGEYVLLLDNDILLNDKNLLKNLIEFYSKTNKPGFISLLMHDLNKSSTKYYGIFYSLYGVNTLKKEINISKILDKNIKIGSFNGGAVFFKKNTWESLGGYDELQPFMLDDFDISARAYLFDYKNYLFSKSVVTHLGKEKDIDKKYFAWKYNYYYSGILTMMLKNYNLHNLIFRGVTFILFSIIFNIILIIIKRNIYLINSFFLSYYTLLLNLPSILKKRKDIQSRRLVDKDIFLNIFPPRID